MVGASDTSDKRLDRQQSYQQFHLGVYISLVTLIIGGSIFSDKKISLGWSVYLVVSATAFLMLAGIRTFHQRGRTNLPTSKTQKPGKPSASYEPMTTS